MKSVVPNAKALLDKLVDYLKDHPIQSTGDVETLIRYFREPLLLIRNSRSKPTNSQLATIRSFILSWALREPDYVHKSHSFQSPVAVGPLSRITPRTEFRPLWCRNKYMTPIAISTWNSEWLGSVESALFETIVNPTAETATVVLQALSGANAPHGFHQQHTATSSKYTWTGSHGYNAQHLLRTCYKVANIKHPATELIMMGDGCTPAEYERAGARSVSQFMQHAASRACHDVDASDLAYAVCMTKPSKRKRKK